MRLSGSTLMCALGLSLLACGGTPPASDNCKGRKAGDLVLTELMIDPDGVDTGAEFIELHNTLGTELNLAGFTLEVKKGDGSAAKSHNIRAGTVAAKGYFVAADIRSGPNPQYVNYSYAETLGSMNNSDGIVTLRCGTTLIDTFKYTSSTPAKSKSYDGAKPLEAIANDDEASWCTGATVYTGANEGTPGIANANCPAVVTGDSCLENGTARAIVAPQPGQLVVTEVMANPKGTDTGAEWFELRATTPVDLNGLTFSWGTSKSKVTSADCVRLADGEHGTIAKSTDPLVNGGLSNVKATFTFALTNSAAVLKVDSDDAGIEAASLPASLDGVAWQVDPSKVTDATANDDPAGFCRATSPFGPDAGSLGTPGVANTACPTPIDPNNCLDADTAQSRPIVRPTVGQLVISEFLADPSAVGDTDGEWFEVVATSDVDLNGLVLGNESATKATVGSQTCLKLAAGASAVFAKKADPALNGGLLDVKASFGFSLANSGARSITVSSGATLVDSITYSAATAGASSQLSSTKLDAVLNDTPANFCPTPVGTTYGASADGGVGDRGSPGTANVACP
jgi:Lamin Tail Domain